MGIKTVSHPPYSWDLAPCDFWLFPKLGDCRYETIEEMKEAVMKVIDTLTQEDFHGALQKLLEWYNKCIATGGEYFKGDMSFMRVLSIKVPIWKKSGNLLRALIYLIGLFSVKNIILIYWMIPPQSKIFILFFEWPSYILGLLNKKVPLFIEWSSHI